MAHGRYTIVGKLADGGMAEIFLAMQHGAEGFQKPVVLKRVLTAFSADPQFRNMFLDEAQISMSLNHGNIVQVLDVGVSGERTFLVLELIEGWDLEKVMERAQATGPEHPWPPSLALYVTAQICRGLGYAHAKRGPDGRSLGIVHRDVSPTNVLISEQGEVKLADFGIAKAESKREQTLAGVIKGKIGFMSPEQALGRPLDARADLFSVGTVMYLMLTGRKPFDAGSELESMTLAQRAEYRPPEELNPYLSPDATAIVRRAMERDPAQRYQTADHMLIDVERVLRGQYHSAGQTELKLWLAELARRDGVAPIGRVPREDGAATPMFVDQSGELSAGASLQLSDMDASAAAAAAAAATAVALPVVKLPGATPPPQSAAGLLRVPTPPREGFRATPGGPATTPPPLNSARPAATPGGLDGPVERPGGGGSWPPVDVAGAATPSPSGPQPAEASSGATRLPRRGRVGLGFALGAVCMLGTVFGIRWLAHWAGQDRNERREPIGGITHWYSSNPDSSAASPGGPARAATSSAAASSDASGGDPGLAGTPAAARAVPAGGGGDWGGVPAAGKALAAGAANSGMPPAVKATPPPTTPSTPTATPALAALEEDETRLLGQVVPDAAAVVGEDEAEDNAARHAVTTGKLKEPGGGAAADTVTAGPPAGSAGPGRVARTAGDPERKGSAARSPTAARSSDNAATRSSDSAATRLPPVQVRITSSPLGAVVRTKKQVLGRTPLAVHFNPGNTYELTFVKSGYITKSRRLTVRSGKPQSISLAMKKTPPPRHSFFHRR